jgi:predicted nucleotidyltransferase
VLTIIQHMMKRNQQSLNNRQSANNIPRTNGDETPIANDTIVDKDYGNILDNYGALFRKSSLVLIVTLGRQYTTRFHVRDLSRLLNYDVSLMSKNLRELECFGLVKHEDVGNLVLYTANMNSVLLKQVKICFTLLELNDFIHKIDPISSHSILYGSCAKGEDTSSSDIDLFIETIEKDAVRGVMDNCQKTLTRTLAPVIATPDEMYKMKMTDNTFFSSINQGIILKEVENVF